MITPEMLIEAIKKVAPSILMYEPENDYITLLDGHIDLVELALELNRLAGRP